MPKMINVRLTDEETLRLRAFINDANDLAEEAGLPRTITMTGILRLWIRERLDALESVGSKKVYQAPHVLAAQTMLRKNRK